MEYCLGVSLWRHSSAFAAADACGFGAEEHEALGLLDDMPFLIAEQNFGKPCLFITRRRSIAALDTVINLINPVSGGIR